MGSSSPLRHNEGGRVNNLVIVGATVITIEGRRNLIVWTMDEASEWKCGGK